MSRKEVITIEREEGAKISFLQRLKCFLISGKCRKLAYPDVSGHGSFFPSFLGYSNWLTYVSSCPLLSENRIREFYIMSEILLRNCSKY